MKLDDIDILESLDTPPRDLRQDIKKLLKIRCVPIPTYIIAISFSLEHNNRIMNLFCEHGVPIGQENYDHKKNIYSALGSGYSKLGWIPISFQVYLENSHWHQTVPIPESQVEKFLDESQLNQLNCLKIKLHQSIRYVQFI